MVGVDDDDCDFDGGVLLEDLPLLLVMEMAFRVGTKYASVLDSKHDDVVVTANTAAMEIFMMMGRCFLLLLLFCVKMVVRSAPIFARFGLFRQ
mmetsp:Transcript_8013/g.11697  ORF Transcript_8013/g.11697 Transcript_8013/m.11697 type:complete len:93 (-) Transcript_8013:57-335(-)